ncbi:MAG: glycosyltransferase family 2 protein [bacterium]
MILSIVIPTYNKQALLARTLTALSNQDLHDSDWEIIVVDDGSIDGTEAFLRTVHNQPGIRLRSVRPAQNCGRAMARNLGAQAASGRWLLFIDDDIVVPPGLLAAHLELLRNNPGCGTIGTVRTEASLIDGPHFHYIDSRGVAKISSGDVPARYFVTQNAAVPRDDFLAVGGFETRFSAYGLEDMEVAFRLEDQRGMRFLPLTVPEPQHVHHHTLHEYLDKKREVGRFSLPLLASLHPDRVSEMRLHWVIDSVPDQKNSIPISLFRLAAMTGLVNLLISLVKHWSTGTAHLPRLSRFYYRLLDIIILLLYRQGVTEGSHGCHNGD